MEGRTTLQHRIEAETDQHKQTTAHTSPTPSQSERDHPNQRSSQQPPPPPPPPRPPSSSAAAVAARTHYPLVLTPGHPSRPRSLHDGQRASGGTHASAAASSASAASASASAAAAAAGDRLPASPRVPTRPARGSCSRGESPPPPPPVQNPPPPPTLPRSMYPPRARGAAAMAGRHSPPGLRSGDSGAGEFEFGGGTQVPGRNWGCPDWIRGDGDGGAGIWFELRVVAGAARFCSSGSGCARVRCLGMFP